MISATATLNFPSINAYYCSDLTITVTGAVSGDCVSLGVPNVSVPSVYATFTAWVSANDTVTVRYYNGDGVASNPASGTFKVMVMK